jgi:hypothetical protein
VTVNVTEPVHLQGTGATVVECEADRGRYSAKAREATFRGYKVSFDVEIASFPGPGRHPAEVTVQVSAPGGQVTEGTAPNVPVSVADRMGSLDARLPLEGGDTLALSLAWACSA